MAATSGRLAKIQLLADLLKQAGPDEVELAIAYLSGTVRQSKIGVGWATLQKAKSHVGTSGRLQVRDVDETLEKISTTVGKGSAGEKQRLLGALFSQATKDEQDFLFRLLTGELRQGALEGIIARAPRGDGGFGYDGVFEVPGLGRTLAELSPAEKDAISHRGRAIRALVRRLAGIST